MTSFQLFTSIKPPTNADELTDLNDCLDSWRAAGFSPVAVNGPKETEALRQLNLAIEFAPLRCNGKPRIGLILSAIRDSGARFAGIINSDCRIVRYPNLAAHLEQGLKGAVVLAWRIDLGKDLKPTSRRGGFDAFFFDTNIIPRDDGGFSIADPWWDFWFPLACEMNGARLETLTLPLLTHKAHPENWSESSYIRKGQCVWDMLQTWHRRGDMPDSLRAELPNALRSHSRPSRGDLERLCTVSQFWLFECRPQNIAVMGPHPTEIETILRFGGHSLYNEALGELRRRAREVEFAHTEAELTTVKTELRMAKAEIMAVNAELTTVNAELTTVNTDLTTVNAELTTVNAELTTVNAELTTVKAELTAIKAELTTVRATLSQTLNSTCWRLTAPLRRAVIMGRAGWQRLSEVQ